MDGSNNFIMVYVRMNMIGSDSEFLNQLRYPDDSGSGKSQ